MRKHAFLGVFLLALAAFPVFADWQIDVTFPDWKESLNANFLVNDITSFYGNKGQGTLFVTPSDNCKNFSVYVNGNKLSVAAARKGHTAAIDISSCTKDGINALQVSDITPPEATVQVCVPYPTVRVDRERLNTPKLLKENGISPKAFALIDRIIKSDIAHGFGAAQLAVIKNGTLIYSNAWGNVQSYNADGSRIENAPRVSTDTLFDLASNTKMYSVNYALQYLVSLGKISLDDTIAQYLGDAFFTETIDIHYRMSGRRYIPNAENKAYKKNLTIRDLLRHQGGFPSSMAYYNDQYSAETLLPVPEATNALYAGAAADSETRENTFRALCKTPLLYKPGSDTLYSDLDYLTLCFVIEKATGMPLDAFLKAVFWEPLGLTHITYRPLDNGFAPTDCAATELRGNTRNGVIDFTGARTKVIQGKAHDELCYYSMAGVSGHAGLFSNAEDLATLAFAMLSGGYAYERFFSRDVLDLFVAPKNESAADWGLGWWRQADHGTDKNFGSIASPSVFGHQGFTGTLTVIDPAENMVIVFLSNKIHSQLIKGSELQSKFYGNFMLTGSLGFVTQIIRLGMQDEKHLTAVYQSLIRDAIADARRRAQAEHIAESDTDHPYIRALKALEAVQ